MFSIKLIFGRVLMRVGPFMAEYETLATGHVAKVCKLNTTAAWRVQLFY